MNHVTTPFAHAHILQNKVYMYTVNGLEWIVICKIILHELNERESRKCTAHKYNITAMLHAKLFFMNILNRNDKVDH